LESQCSLTCEHFRSSIFPSEDVSKVLLTQALFFHAKSYCIDWTWHVECISFLLIVFDKLRQELEPIALGCSRCGVIAREAIYLRQVLSVLLLALDDFRFHKLLAHPFRVLSVRLDVANNHDAGLVRNFDFQPIAISFNV